MCCCLLQVLREGMYDVTAIYSSKMDWRFLASDDLDLYINQSTCCCLLQVLREGMYDVAAIYSSKRQAPFKLSVGMYRDIQAGRALSIRVQLPQQVRATRLLLRFCDFADDEAWQ
jgi:hypothetical protein